MRDKRFSTNGYYIFDTYKDDQWLVNEVEADLIVDKMNNLDEKARERSKALSKLQKENKLLKEALREELQDNGNSYYIEIFDKLFNLDYDEWNRNERYRECMNWEALLKKEMSK